MLMMTEDAADVRHDAPYVPPVRCSERLVTPRLHCRSNVDSVHRCGNPRVTHTTMCQCQCGFTWDISAHVPNK